MPEHQTTTNADKGKKVLEQWQLMEGKSSSFKNKKRKNKNKAVTEGTTKPPQTTDDKPQVTDIKQEVANGGGGEKKLNVKEAVRKEARKERKRQSSRVSLSVHAGIDKSCKELHRHLTALEHSKLTLKERLDRSYKRVSEVFKELRQEMKAREDSLVAQLDSNKNKAFGFMNDYGSLCAGLKVQTDRVVSMEEKQVEELRGDIKNISVERRHLEELAQITWFSCQFDDLLQSIRNFGQVTTLKTSADSKLLHKHLQNDHPKTDVDSKPSTNAPATPGNPPLSTFILAQSDSLTKYEQQAQLQKSQQSNNGQQHTSNDVTTDKQNKNISDLKKENGDQKNNVANGNQRNCDTTNTISSSNNNTKNNSNDNNKSETKNSKSVKRTNKKYVKSYGKTATNSNDNSHNNDNGIGDQCHDKVNKNSSVSENNHKASANKTSNNNDINNNHNNLNKNNSSNNNSSNNNNNSSNNNNNSSNNNNNSSSNRKRSGKQNKGNKGNPKGGVSQQNGSDDRTEHAVDGPSTDDKRADVSDKGSKKCAEEELKGGSEIINGSTSN